MKNHRLALQTLALSIVLGTLFSYSSTVIAQDRVTVQPRKVVLIRTGKIVRDFPEKRKATVRYPIVLGLSDPTVLRRIQNAISVKSIFNSTLKEYREDTWLEEFDYQVNYNKNYLLDITFTQSGSGAYPSTQIKHLLINLKDGKIVTAGDAFDRNSLTALAKLVDLKLKDEVKETLKENEEDTSSGAEGKSWVRDELKKLEFGVKDLDEFSVNDKGVTFIFDAGFPHAIQALQPVGEYFFTYAELRAYVKGNGPLGIFK